MDAAAPDRDPITLGPDPRPADVLAGEPLDEAGPRGRVGTESTAMLLSSLANQPAALDLPGGDHGRR